MANILPRPTRKPIPPFGNGVDPNEGQGHDYRAYVTVRHCSDGTVTFLFEDLRSELGLDPSPIDGEQSFNVGGHPER